MPARTVLGALLLDALDEFERVVAAIPPPGRHRRIGRLNAPGWTIAHLASSFDAWLNVFVQRLSVDPWASDVFERQRALPRGLALDVPFDDARTGFARAAERARPYLEAADAAALAEPAAVPPSPWTEASGSYFLARSIAHVFAHAGDLTVTAALTGAGDVGLPGALAATGAAA
ncbi:MAG: DinB family protein, partial [Chloroflexi bacterium]|nr:DinB family protein [Chloroflexota bacterium]